jgi:hypothetical protein
VSCPHCEQPLDAVVIYREINDNERWERQTDGTWLRTEHTVTAADLDQYCADCGTTISSSEVPGTVDER